MSVRLNAPLSLLGFSPALFARVRSSAKSRLARDAEAGRGHAVCPRHAHVADGPGMDHRKIDAGTAIERRGIAVDRNGDVTITSHALAKQVLRSRSTQQAGFNADLVRLFPQRNTTVLFLEGEDHRLRRSVVAHFFAPATVRDRYRPIMEAVSDELIGKLVRTGSAALEDMSLELAVGITAEIVGVTESPRLALAKRLVRFFEGEACIKASGWMSIARYILAMQVNLLRVYVHDVRPAIRDRRRKPRNDLVSCLVAKHWSALDILKECVTYATAGMSTTREFIVVAAWHLLEDRTLRQRFLDGDDVERTALLGEILRLEPPVATIFRKTLKAVTVQHDGGRQTEIASGARIAIDIAGTNTDAAAAGPCPFMLDAARKISGPVGLMSFGDGHHRCPGAAIAIEEAAVFLDRLLRVPNIRLASTPTLSRNKMSTGYVVRNAVVTMN